MEAFQALMRAAGQLELCLEEVYLNTSLYKEFDYDTVGFSQGLVQMSAAWSTAVKGRQLRELCIMVEPEWIKAACGTLIIRLRIGFQTGSPFELELTFFGGSSYDKSFPGESSFWDLAEEQLNLGPEGWSQTAAMLPFEQEDLDPDEDEQDGAFPPYPDIYPAVVARFVAEHLAVTKLHGLRYAGRCKDSDGLSCCESGDFRFSAP